MFDFGAGAIEVGLNAYHDGVARDWQEGQTDKKYKRDIEQRDYMNWYNSPEQQMKRFKEAGLNPNMIYGKGTPGLQSSAPTQETAKGRWTPINLPKINPMDMLGQFQGIKKTMAETDLTNEVLAGQKITNALKTGSLESQISQEYSKNLILIQKTTNENLKETLIQRNIELVNQNIRLKKTQANMRDQGIETSDNKFWRYGSQNLHEGIGLLKQGFKAWQDYKSGKNKNFIPHNFKLNNKD